jgi:hypothetical protein
MCLSCHSLQSAATNIWSLALADPKSSCRLAPIAVTPSSFNVRGSATQVKYFAENNTVGLSLLGIAGPTLTSLYPTFYGMYSMSLWVNTKNGVNTAFYVSAAVDPAKHAYRQPSRHESHIQIARLLLCAWRHSSLDASQARQGASAANCCQLMLLLYFMDTLPEQQAYQFSTSTALAPAALKQPAAQVGLSHSSYSSNASSSLRLTTCINMQVHHLHEPTISTGATLWPGGHAHCCDRLPTTTQPS